MSNAFEEIKEGLQEAIEHAKGKNANIVMHTAKPVNVKSVRKKTGMSQQQFCAAFGLSLGTLRHWERGDRQPRGPALVLLNVVKKNPRAVLDALTV